MRLHLPDFLIWTALVDPSGANGEANRLRAVRLRWNVASLSGE
jgi:hypothetical protein